VIRELNRLNTEDQNRGDRDGCGGRPGCARLHSEGAFDLGILSLADATWPTRFHALMRAIGSKFGRWFSSTE
jgi:hypothetical protein